MRVSTSRELPVLGGVVSGAAFPAQTVKAPSTACHRSGGRDSSSPPIPSPPPPPRSSEPQWRFLKWNPLDVLRDIMTRRRCTEALPSLMAFSNCLLNGPHSISFYWLLLWTRFIIMGSYGGKTRKKKKITLACACADACPGGHSCKTRARTGEGASLFVFNFGSGISSQFWGFVWTRDFSDDEAVDCRGSDMLRNLNPLTAWPKITANKEKEWMNNRDTL